MKSDCICKKMYMYKNNEQSNVLRLYFCRQRTNDGDVKCGSPAAALSILLKVFITNKIFFFSPHSSKFYLKLRISGYLTSREWSKQLPGCEHPAASPSPLIGRRRKTTQRTLSTAPPAIRKSPCGEPPVDCSLSTDLQPLRLIFTPL